MIVLDCEQTSAEWHFARLGVPTSSNFHRIVTPTLKPSASAKTYLHELLAAFFVGEAQDSESNPWMTRGSEMKREARAWYEFDHGVTVEQVGFCLRDDERVGASPDGMVGDDGLVEIKCPAAKVHIGHMLGEDAHKHLCQVQGQLLITGRAWCDLLVYSPCLPPTVTRYEPDGEWREAFEPALAEFLERLEEAKGILRARGLVGKDGKR